MKKICVLTGTRAEYGLLKPVMLAIKHHPGLRLQTIAAGMHLSREFGYSLTEIKKDGFTIHQTVAMHPKTDTGSAMARSVGQGITRLVSVFEKLKPDVVLVLGDRIEPLAAAIAAGYMNIPLAHIHGGDISRGGLDESVRHVITKLAHIHFPATATSALRIKKLGEDSWRIFKVGAPGIDAIKSTSVLPKTVLAKKYSLNFTKPLFVMVQHSISTEPEKAGKQVRITLDVIKSLKHQTLIVYPNSDAGGRAIIKEMNKYTSLPFIRVLKNLSQQEYYSFLKYASVLVGNTSSGMIESSLFKIPVVNIGTRQQGRQRSTNVLDVPHNKKAIQQALTRTLSDKKFKAQVKRCKNPYGNGTAGKQIATILARLKLSNKWLQKQINYSPSL